MAGRGRRSSWASEDEDNGGTGGYVRWMKMVTSIQVATS